jgi:tRNA(Arg) A34 adenosine deaminase TadA
MVIAEAVQSINRDNKGGPMAGDGDINRRDLMVQTAGAIGAAGVVAGVGLGPALAQASRPLPAGFDAQKPMIENWNKTLSEIAEVNLRLDANELDEPAVRERHRIYCYLLMKLIHRFWNGNKHGPFGRYPQREQQREVAQLLQEPGRYRGDMIDNPDGHRINWDRYLGHNIACLAVDGNGEIIDFDFNHNDFFRSSAEHAESRMVRRLFSLTDIFDTWRTGRSSSGSPRNASLNDITLYTSLESCAQCSGVMSLANIKQVIYLQNDFTTYKIGNIMYKLANRLEVHDANGKVIGSTPGAPVPIAASEVELEEFDQLNQANLEFTKDIVAAGSATPSNLDGAFFIPKNGEPDFSPSITSFLCTDKALRIFADGGNKLDAMTIAHKISKVPKKPDDAKAFTNEQCLAHAVDFYKYADIEGYRGSPHKL